MTSSTMGSSPAPSPRRWLASKSVHLVGRNAVLLLAAVALGCAPPAPQLDLVLAGGHVMDPESGLDGVRNVGIRNGRVAALSEEALTAAEVVDVSGLVVVPGFIDLHAHGQDPVSRSLQARDGVTTALELEIGVYPVADWLESQVGASPINFGASAGHLPARIKLLYGVDVGSTSTMSAETRSSIGGTEYAYAALDDEHQEELAALLRRGLDQGGLGFGFGITYTPGATRSEILRLFGVAAQAGVPCFVHLRGAPENDLLGPFQEVIADAASSGASLHVVHLNSSADETARDALELIRGARRHGVDVTTEAYPYTAGSTRLESALFDGWEERPDADFSRLQWARTGERLDRDSFLRYRAEGGWVIIHGRSEETSEWITAQPDVIVASDGIPFLDGPTHPRGAGTYARILGHYVRERQALSLMDALRKMTLLPAQRLERIAPDMQRKGRIRVGADADITVFDPARVQDRATYEKADQPSAGIVHVLVGGTFVVRDEEPLIDAHPGQPVRGGPVSLPGV